MGRERGQHHGDLRPALLDAAQAIIDEGDLEGLTLRAVARRAGVSPSATYHHFADKAALLDAVALDGFEQLAAVQARTRARTPQRRLEALTTAYVRFAVEHPSHYAVMTASLSDVPGTAGPRSGTELGAQLAATARGTFDHLVAAVQEVRPDLGSVECSRRAFQIWAQAHGAVSLLSVASGLDERFDADALARGVAASAVAIALA